MFILAYSHFGTIFKKGIIIELSVHFKSLVPSMLAPFSFFHFRNLFDLAGMTLNHSLKEKLFTFSGRPKHNSLYYEVFGLGAPEWLPCMQFWRGRCERSIQFWCLAKRHVLVSLIAIDDDSYLFVASAESLEQLS